MTSYRFFKMVAGTPAAIFDLIWVTLAHPRSVIVGLSLMLKFGFDWIYFFFGDIAIFIFRHFGLKFPIQGHFGAELGAYFPK